MKQELKTSIHNRFDIYKTNLTSGETQQIAFAENIVLNQMWTQLINRGSYFVNIHYGSGTGTLSTTRTSLFTHLGTKAAINDTLIKTFPTASWKRKITINPEDNVGAILTEVGISYDENPSHLVTHAMLKDMNGNLTTITKTSADVIVIYATVYVTFSTSDPKLVLCGLPNNNPLMNYLIGGVGIGPCYFYTGTSKFPSVKETIGVLDGIILGQTAGITWTADVANKKMTTSTPRFAVGESNGHIGEVVFGTSVTTPIFRIQLPAETIYAGLSLSDVPIGTGDGITRKFDTPSKNVRDSSVAVFLDGVQTTNFTIEKGTSRKSYLMRQILFEKYNSGGGCMFSEDQKVFAITTIGSPYIRTYDVLGEATLCERPYPVDLPVGAINCALSGDGSILVVTQTGAPYMTTYKWITGTWVKQATPAVLPTGQGNSCSLSYDGLVLAIAHNTTPYITTYDWISNTWVKRTNPSVLPTGTATCCTLSSDGLLLVVSHATTPFITTYDWISNTWVKRTNPAELPVGTGNSCSLSADKLVLAVAHNDSPFITTYDWTAGSWVKRANPAELPASTGNSCSLSGDGDILVITEPRQRGDSNINENFCWFIWSDDTWVKQSILTEGWNIDRYSSLIMANLTKDGKLCAIASYSTYSGYGAQLLDMGSYSTRIVLDSAPATGTIITANYTVDGIHKTEQRVIDFNTTITFGTPI